MLIIIGSFIEIGEEYLKKFKMHIESYETSLEKKDAVSERQQIKNEFLGTVAENSIFDNLINDFSRNLQQTTEDIAKEHRKKIDKVERKNKRKIKVAKTFKIVGSAFLSKTFLNLSLKKYEEVKQNRSLLEQELASDWQKLTTYNQRASTVFQPLLDETIEEVIIIDRMNTADVDTRKTNEELENVLGEQILGEAIQDKHEIGKVFKELLYKFSKKNEREDNR